MAIRKTIKLKNYEGKIKTFDIALSSRSDADITIVYTKQAGDEVVYIFQFRDLVYTLDSCEDIRTFDLLDEIKLLTLEELENLNQEAE